MTFFKNTTHFVLLNIKYCIICIEHYILRLYWSQNIVYANNNGPGSETLFVTKIEVDLRPSGCWINCRYFIHAHVSLCILCLCEGGALCVSSAFGGIQPALAH